MAIRKPEDFRHFEASLPGIKIHYVREGQGPVSAADEPAGHQGLLQALSLALVIQ